MFLSPKTPSHLFQTLDPVLTSNPYGSLSRFDDAPHSPETSIEDVFTSMLPELDEFGVFDFLESHYEKLFPTLEPKKMLFYLKNPLICQGLNFFFLNSTENLFYFFEQFPTIDLLRCHPIFLENCRLAIQDPTQKVRDFTKHPTIGNYLKNCHPLELLDLYEVFKGKFWQIPKMYLNPLLEIFKKFEFRFSTKESLKETISDCFSRMDFRIQRALLIHNSFCLRFHQIYDKNFLELDALLTHIPQESVEARKLFVLPFLSNEEQRKIIMEALFETGRFATAPHEVFATDTYLEEIPLSQLVHHLIRCPVAFGDWSFMSKMQMLTLNSIKKHVNILIRQYFLFPEMLDELDPSWESLLMEKAVKHLNFKLCSNEDYRNLPLGQFLVMLKKNPPLLDLFKNDDTIHGLAAKCLDISEEELFTHHKERIAHLLD
jgi:hypothetical protein